MKKLFLLGGAAVLFTVSNSFASAGAGQVKDFNYGVVNNTSDVINVAPGGTSCQYSGQMAIYPHQTLGFNWQGSSNQCTFTLITQKSAPGASVHTLTLTQDEGTGALVNATLTNDETYKAKVDPSDATKADIVKV